MQKKGKDLEFISWIKRDGSGTSKRITKSHIATMQEEVFNIHCLSISEKTYIASAFNAFVVRLKPILKVSKEQQIQDFLELLHPLCKIVIIRMSDNIMDVSPQREIEYTANNTKGCIEIMLY